MKIIKILNVVALTIASLLVVGCAGKTPRTKWTDKTMRVMIDPDSIEAGHHVRIQNALVASGKWFVVDRASGFRAIKKEQEALHRESQDRFEDREKWAHWGKLYGVGGVVIAKAQCADKQTWFVGKKYTKCLQYLAIVDANTGIVIAAVEAESDGDAGEQNIAPSWEDAVAKLNNAYPENYQTPKDHQILQDYRAVSKEEAVRQKEAVAKEQVDRAVASQKEAQ